jgi:hypothetical protein
MSNDRPLHQRRAGLIALALGLLVGLGSLVPRGWFLCLHDDGAVALADQAHASAQDAHHCIDDGCGHDDTGCLDLAVALVLDDQPWAIAQLLVLPPAPLLLLLPSFDRVVLGRRSGRAGVPAPSPPGQVLTIRLQV